MVSQKVRIAVTAAVMFFIISNPVVYRIVDGFVGGALGRIATPSGCPTTWGLIVHSAVFGLANYYGLGV